MVFEIVYMRLQYYSKWELFSKMVFFPVVKLLLLAMRNNDESN